MAISRKELLHIAKLAKLTIDEAQLKTFKEQFENIIGFVSQLKEVDVSDIDSTDVGHINDEVNNWREDEVFPSDEKTRKDLLKNAPSVEKGHISVPGVFDT